MAKYLDSNGLLYVWEKIKTLVSGKVDKVDGKQLSTNDYTAAEKTKLAGVATGANAYTHPAYTAKASGLYKVTVDASGHVSATAAVAKSDITALGIPGSNTTYGAATSSAPGLMPAADKAKLDALPAASAIALKTDITGMYKYKGSKAAAANLPTSGNAVGDVWNVTATGMNYAWDGTAWDALGTSLAVEGITNAEIDAILAV